MSTKSSKLKKIKTLIIKKWKLLGIVTIAIALVIFFVKKSHAKDEQPLTFEHPIRQSITKTLDVSGYVDAKEKARMRFIAGGKIVYIGAQEGDTVKKWQTIATIDKASLQKSLDKSLNLYMKQRWDWEDSVDNNRDKYLTLSERRSVDKKQWDLDNKVIDVEIQDIAIKNTALYAPFAGILTHSPTSVAGVQVLASDYFEVVNPDSLVFRAAVDESDIARVMKGQKAELNLDSYSDETINTAVNYISYTSSETSSGTAFVVEFPLSKKNISANNQLGPDDNFFNQNRFRIGMNGDISIILETKEDVLTIPEIAITQRDAKNYVTVKVNDDKTTRANKRGSSNTTKTEEREIKIGLETDDLVEVIEGLSETDEIVVPER